MSRKRLNSRLLAFDVGFVWSYRWQKVEEGGERGPTEGSPEEIINHDHGDVLSFESPPPGKGALDVRYYVVVDGPHVR